MAEQVQAALDQMVAPLRDLMDRHIFAEDEIRAIVSRRRESEYLLRRRAARKADFVRYIEAEMLLEKLRALRTARRKRDHRKAQRDKGIDLDVDPDTDGEKKKEGDKEDQIGDVHIVQHIHLLFVRAIRKFRGDLSLHLQHAEFCKSAKSWTRLSRVYAEALQVFPREAGIWIEAASNEFFGPNRSVKSARVLMQRALRLNGTSSEELWLQYFSLELHYSQTLKGRRKILRPDEVSENDDSDDDGDDDDKEIFDASDYNRIPMVILRNAIRSIPDNVRFRLKFLDVCQQFPGTADLMETVQSSMASDFADEPESWIARAMYKAEQHNKTDEPKAKRARTVASENDGEDDTKDPVVAVLENAITTLPTSEMFLQAFRFAEDYMNELEENGDGSATIKDYIEQALGFIDTVWSRSKDESLSVRSPEVAMEETRYLLAKGEKENALRIIKDYCCTTRPRSAFVPSEAWLLWASLVPSSSVRKQTSILKRALESTPMDQHPDYVTILLQCFATQLKLASGGAEKGERSLGKKDRTEHDLFDSLQKLLLLSPKTVGDLNIENGSTGLGFEFTSVFEGYSACLECFYQKRGISGARSVYEAVLFRSNAASFLSEESVDGIRSFVDRCLELEEESRTTTNHSECMLQKSRDMLCVRSAKHCRQSHTYTPC